MSLSIYGVFEVLFVIWAFGWGCELGGCGERFRVLGRIVAFLSGFVRVLFRSGILCLLFLEGDFGY